MQQEPNSSISPANFPVPHVTGSPHPASSIDWAGIAPHVAEALLGPHNSRLSSRAEWRWGSKGSFRLRLDSGRWTDFEANARGGVLDLVLRETGRTEPADALKWLQEQGFLNQTGPQTPSETASAATKRPIPASTHSSGPERTVPPSKNAPDTLQRARQDWQNSQPIPMDADHPARRWLAARNLWWPELPLPRAVRWLPRASRWPQHDHVGAVVSLAAAPRHWQETWSKLPPLECLLYVFVDRDGRPVLDRPEASGGRDKRSRGPQLGTVVVLGDPRPGDSCGLALAEGLADALALASRGMDTAVQAVGTSGLKNLADRGNRVAVRMGQRDGVGRQGPRRPGSPGRGRGPSGAAAQLTGPSGECANGAKRRPQRPCRRRRFGPTTPPEPAPGAPGHPGGHAGTRTAPMGGGPAVRHQDQLGGKNA